MSQKITYSLSQQQMVDILEDLAENSQSDTAKIQAIKMLQVMQDGGKPAAGELGALYEVSNPGRTRAKAA